MIVGLATKVQSLEERVRELDETADDLDVEKFDPDWVVAPGDTLDELRQERGWSVEETARRCGNVPLGLVREILDGDAKLTYAIAYFLEIGTGVSRRFWINYERRYRDGLRKGKTRS